MNRILTTCIALFVCLTFVRTEVTVEKGAYGNVLVSFSQNVPSNKGHILLEKLQEHLSETSNLLRNAINLGISTVTFVIPRSWDTSEWNETVEPPLSESDTKPDILVDDVQDSVFGTFPVALQHGSCSVPGARIVVPSVFLTDDDAFPKGTALAREWLKYRYGVFDENGYTGDELYPIYYHIPGSDPTDVKVTGCTNKDVVYNFINSTGSECTPYTGKETTDECRAHPEKESLENVTSSLMYFHEEIPNMQHVCGKDPEHQHSSRSLNKHNSLCRGQSVWEVLKMSSDFGDSNSSESEIASEDSSTIQFNYVQEPKPRVVIAWEYTTKLKSQGTTVLKAVKKFLYDLPAGYKYALAPFTDTIPADKANSLQELNNWPDDWKNIKISSDFFPRTAEGCVKCAIEKALDIVASDNPDEPSDTAGTAIIIASSNSETDEGLLDRLRKSKMCLMLLVFSNGETQAYQDYTDASPCGTLVELPLDGDMVKVFETLFEAMESVLPETVGDKITETVKTENVKNGSSIDFPVNEETVGKVTFWILRDELFKVSDPSIVESKTIDGKDFELTDEGTTDMLALSFSPEQSGRVEMRLHDEIVALVQVRVTSKPGIYVSGDIHFHDTTKGNSEGQQMPVILYARVRFGSYPVQNAEVSAEISRPGGQPVSHVKMYDDGSGDPDITANDGVYSGYFIEFSEKGEYEVTVTVKNNEDAATAGKLNDRKGYESCCGSKLETGTVQIKSFEKTFKTTFSARSGPPDNGYQPSRIVDLRVDNAADDKVVLKWTAPGAQADKGTAYKYEMKLFCEEGENATDCNFHKMVKLLDKPSPKIYGSKQKVTVQILDKSQTLSMGIVTVNGKNQESDLSNTIAIFKPGHDTEEFTINPDTSRDEVKPSQGTIIGSSIAGGIIFICIVIGTVCFCQNKQKNKMLTTIDIEATKNENGTQANKASDYSTSGSPVRKVESFPVLLYTHDQLKDLKRKDRDPPLYKDGVQSKPWVSLNVLSNSKTIGNSESDTKSLSSLSTVPIDSSTESNKTN